MKIQPKKEDVAYFFPVYIAMAGEITLYVDMIITKLEFLSDVTLDPNFSLIRAIAMVAGIIMLSLMLASFGTKYRKNPSRTRLTVLYALIAFIVTLAAYFHSTFTKYTDPILDRYSMDLANIGLIIGVYCFVVFGISVLISQTNEARVNLFKKIFDIGLTCTFILFLISKLLHTHLPNLDISSDLDSISATLIYAFGGLSFIFMLAMAIKSIRIARETSDQAIKHGLVSLGFAYIFLISACILLLLYNLIKAIGNVKEVMFGVMALLGFGFYFIYAGFVKPSSGKA